MPNSDRLPLHVRVRIEQRDARLQRLGFGSYVAYLASGCWEATKARYRASDLPQSCVLCGDEHVQLHHTTYERVAEEELADLAPLCATCHQLIHALERRGELGLDFTGLISTERAKRYADQDQQSTKGPTWAELHRGELAQRQVGALLREIKDLFRRYEKRGRSTADIAARLTKAIREGHSILPTDAGPLPYDPQRAHEISRADAEALRSEQILVSQLGKGKSGKLAGQALERARRRAQRART
jgi:hypothetical protein